MHRGAGSDGGDLPLQTLATQRFEAEHRRLAHLHPGHVGLGQAHIHPQGFGVDQGEDGAGDKLARGRVDRGHHPVERRGDGAVVKVVLSALHRRPGLIHSRLRHAQVLLGAGVALRRCKVLRLGHRCLGYGQVLGGRTGGDLGQLRLGARHLSPSALHVLLGGGHVFGTRAGHLDVVVGLRRLVVGGGLPQGHGLLAGRCVRFPGYLVVGRLRVLHGDGGLLHSGFGRGDLVLGWRSLELAQLRLSLLQLSASRYGGRLCRLPISRGRAGLDLAQLGLGAVQLRLGLGHIFRPAASLKLRQLCLGAGELSLSLGELELRIGGIKSRQDIALLDRLPRAHRQFGHPAGPLERELDGRGGYHRAGGVYRGGNGAPAHHYRLPTRRSYRLWLDEPLVGQVSSGGHD